MTSEELLRVYSQAAFTTDVPPDGCDMPIFHRTALLAVAEAAAKEAHRRHCELALHAASELVRLVAPDDVDECYVPRAAVVDIAMELKRKSDALRAAPDGEQEVKP